MQSQQEMEAIIAAKKQEMNSYLDLQKKIRKGGYGRTGYLKFFENGSEITSYYNLLIANNDGEKQKEYQEAQRIFNEKLNANVKLLIEYRKRTHKPKEDGDESSREFEQFVELCELDQKPFEQREEAIKQFVAKWFTITVVNLEDYEKCIARREELDQILAFVRRKYPQDNLLIKELEEGEKRLITAQKNFIGKQIRFLNSRDRVRDISLIVEAETTLKLVSSDKSINRFFEAEVLPGREDKPFDKTFSSEKKKLEGAIQNAKMFNYCEKKFLHNPGVILDQFRDVASKNTNPFMAAIQESVRGKDIERLQACIRKVQDNSVNIDKYYAEVDKTIDDLLQKMKRKTKFGRAGMGNFETVLRALKTEIAEASRPVANFGEQLSAATSELRDKPTKQSAVSQNLIHSEISNAGDVADVERAKSDNSNAKKKRPRPSRRGSSSQDQQDE